MRFLFSYSKNTSAIDATKIQSSFSLSWYGQKSESESSLSEKPFDHIYSGFLFVCLKIDFKFLVIFLHKSKMLMHKNKNGSLEITSAHCVLLCVYKLLRKAIKIQRTSRYNAHRISL